MPGFVAVVLAFSFAAVVIPRYHGAVQAQGAERPRLTVRPSDDFEVTGTGEHLAWRQAEWTPLQRRQPEGLPYDARFKLLYSSTGLYALMEGTDRKITATVTQDFMDLWKEDVFEIFLWTEERYPIYFEYEISPLNRELPLLIPNLDGQFLGWRPWHFEGDRLTRKATSAIGGPKESQAAVEGWRAEFFIPYTLLKPLLNVPPEPGTRWRANFYRVDYDDGRMTQWDWARVGDSFHEYQKFGEIVFAGR
jgi:hypothetical protein